MGLTRPEEAAAELAARELARRHLLDFATYIWPPNSADGGGYMRARHLEIVCQALEEVELYVRTKGREGTGRLMIAQPPRTSKTETVSKIFPAWLLGRNPDKRVILTAYGADLAQNSSQAVRNYVDSKRFRAVFGSLSSAADPVALSEDSRSKASWDLAVPHRGGVHSTGIGGAIVGRGAHLLIADDPFKNRDEAESEAYRTKVETWWKSAAYTRLEDGGAIVVVHTRWHPDDLAGMLLKLSQTDPLADTYKVIYLPALALAEEDYPRDEAEFKENLRSGIYIPYKDPLGRKPGEALWPEKYDESDLERTRINIGDYEFASQYQQLPRPMTGGFFDDGDWKVIRREELPERLQWYRHVDLAMGQSERSDWNATLAQAMQDKTGNVYARDMVRIHDINEFLPVLKMMMLSREERGTIWGIESVGFQSLVFQEFMRDRELANVAIMEIKPDKDKVTRALPARTRAKNGQYYLVDGPWIEQFKREAHEFPTGKHDDQVDTLSGGLEMIAEIGGPLVAFTV